jgi:Protein of unknown function (DUF4058)
MPVESVVAIEVPLRLYTVEVRETDTLRLVTSVEILSPVNKHPSHEAYQDYPSVSIGRVGFRAHSSSEPWFPRPAARRPGGAHR